MADVTFDATRLVFVSDLDGTLLNDKGRLSDFTSQTLKALHDLHVPLIVSTGRNRRDMQACLGSLPGFDNVAVTYCNGRRIIRFDNSETIQPGVSRSDCALLSERFRTAEIRYFTSEGDFVVKGLGASKLLLKKMLGRSKSLKLVGADAMLKDSERDLIDKVWLFCGNKQAVCDNLNNVLSDDTAAVINHGEVIEIVNRESTKLTAVEKLLGSLGGDEKRVVVFGDDQNDLSLFEQPFERYAVANAIPAIKQLADHTIDANDKDGVARAMLEILDDEGVR